MTAPETPLGVSVAQGDAWQADSHFYVSWQNPLGQETPIAVAHYELCPTVPLGLCTTHSEAGEGISQLNIDLAHVGWYSMSVWLEDAAGNVDPSSKSSLVKLRYDDVPPPGPFAQTDQEWLNAGVAADVPVEIAIDPNAPWQLSGIRGYSVTSDGSFPDNVVEAFAEDDGQRFPGDYIVTGPPEGITSLRMRTVSNAGVASGETGSVEIRIDRTPPAVNVSGIPGEGWSRTAVTPLLTGTDQDHLSGMGAAPDNEPAHHGGHLAYSIDSVSQVARGDTREIYVTQDGTHVVRVEAFDVAGNGSGEEVVRFKIDGTAPEGVFEAGDVDDPRLLRVRVADAVSGVEDGWIEYRRAGDVGFKRLPTRLEGDRLVASIDDEALPRGVYEFRAIVRDVAGNQATVMHRADGGAMALAMPVRGVVEVGAAAMVPKRCGRGRRRRAVSRGRGARGRGARRLARARGRRGGRSKRKRCRRGVRRTTVARLRHGKRVASVGRVTKADGTGAPGATVVVEGQARGGGPFVRLGTTVADGSGAFRFAIPPGPSRTVRYRFAGSRTLLPAAGEVRTRVAAAVRLRVNRRRLVNGEAVRFVGRLLGKPVPAEGKVVALQARVGRRWRTFATPRANARGVFRHRYRFTSTTGLRRYAFRVLVAREAGYSYERGTSRTVRVTVRGRRVR